MVRAGGPRRRAVLLALIPSLAAAGLVGCADDGEVSEPAVTARSGWDVTVYYTAVEHFHDGPPRRVTGCVVDGCVAGRDHIGYYPSDFVDAVEFTGTGRLETGRYAGSYLNWSEEIGFWIDDFARDGNGGVLVPFTSAAADPNVLAQGTVFEVADCGTLADGSPVPTALCEQLSSPRWTIADQLTPGIAGERQVDLYVGDETLTTFANGPQATSFVGAALTIDDGTIAPANPFDPANGDGNTPATSTSTSTTVTTTTTVRPGTTTTTRPGRDTTTAPPRPSVGPN